MEEQLLSWLPWFLKKLYMSLQQLWKVCAEFRKYLEMFYAIELKESEPDEKTGKNHCVYEDHLDDVQYVEGTGGATIRSIIMPDKDHKQERQILCISAAPGYGKEFFAKRICLLNYQESCKAKRWNAWNIGRASKYFVGRWSFVIKFEDMEVFNRIKEHPFYESWYSLCVLCLVSFIRVSGSNKDKLYQPDQLPLFFKKTLNRLKRFLEQGKLFVLFEKNVSMMKIKELKRLIGQDIMKLGGVAQKNLLLFIFDDEYHNPFDSDYSYSIILKKLSDEDIMRHIEFCFGRDASIVSNYKKLIGQISDLNIPDCLLFITETQLSHAQNIPEFNDIAALYQNCIDLIIKNRFSKEKRQRAVRRHLRNQAMLAYYSTYDEIKTYINEKYNIPIDDREKKGLKQKLGRTDHLLTKDGAFRFDGCRDCLIAECLHDMLCSSGKDKQFEFLLNHMNDNIAKRLIEIIVRGLKTDILEKLWNILVPKDKVASSVTFKILVYFMEQIKDIRGIEKTEEFINQIRYQMSEQVYEGCIFEQISDADEHMRDLKINEKLKKIYLDKMQDRCKNSSSEDYKQDDVFNRRCLYYFGIYGAIDEQMMKGLTNPYIHRHVKYHLIRAMMNNVFRDTNVLDIRKFIKKIDDEKIEKNDVILKSYYLILKHMLLDQPIPTILKAELLEEINSEKYWIRAHAADALGHIDDLEIPDKLYALLEDEMACGETDCLNLKVINYVIEAICEFFYFPCYCSKDAFRSESDNRIATRQEIAIKMLEMVKTDWLKVFGNGEEELVMSAYAAIAEGTLYLKRGDFSKRPDFSGKHISDKAEQFDENAQLIRKALKQASEWDQEKKLQSILEAFDNRIDQIRAGSDKQDSLQVQKAEAEEKTKGGGTIINIYGGKQQINTDQATGEQHNTL